jgi:MFS family permease
MVVIFLMAILSVVSFRLGFDQGLSVSLFPIVIMTMAIERMSTVWEERGPRESLLQLTGTMGASALTFWVMNFTWVQHFTLLFPESLLILVGATILLGRYSGYRLVELPRFKVLAGTNK